MDKIDLILHPLRMRILLAMVGQEMTAQQLAASLPDVAQATLYRHINTLADGGILSVIEERPVRGTVEKVYALEDKAATLSPEDLKAMSKGDHLRAFTTFMTFVLSQFQRYLESEDAPDLAADGVGYHQTSLYMSDAELAEFGKALYLLIKDNLKPGPGRKRRLFTTVFMPDVPGE